MTDHSVVVVGAGPTGLMLAGELALAGVDVAIVERRPNQALDASRAGGLYPRTIEVLDQRGIAEPFLAAGQRVPRLSFAGVLLDIGDLPTRHPYVLGLWQREFEPLLAAWVEGLGVPILRAREVVGFVQDDTGVEVHLSGGAPIRTSWLVGCDGGRSVIRKAAGIDFPGFEATASWMIAQVEMTETPRIGVRPEGGGIGPVNRATGGGPYGVVLREPVVEGGRDPTMTELREALVRAYCTDYGAHSPTYISRFTDATRQAATYRSGRVLLAGDAAHVHPPQGGMGLNTGVQDAVSLGWKLGRVVAGTSPETLLDTYEAERHPVGARVLQLTRAIVAMMSPDPREQALREIVGELVAFDEPRRHLAATLSGLAIRYDAEDAGPLVGRRMPDVDLETADGRTRVLALLRDARPLLLTLGGRGDVEHAEWRDRVRFVDARIDGPLELPILGETPPPSAVLIRPDGYVAWAGDLADAGLPRAIATWFGPPRG